MLVCRYLRALCRLAGPFAVTVALFIMLYVALPDGSLLSAPALPTRNSSVATPWGVSGITYTLALPLMPNLCFYTSTRPRLVGSATLPGQITFSNPRHCTTGWPPATLIVANGSYSGTLNNTIWILAYGADSLYYPQSPDPCEGAPAHQANGFWTVPTYLGLSGGPPEWFDLVAIVADSTASQFLSNWLDMGCDNGYTGIPASMFIPFNLTEKAAISVQTTD